MAVFSHAWDADVADVCRGGAVSIGNFDGVHLGHQAILRELVLQAKAVGGPAVAVTFDPHPFQILCPNQCQPAVTTIRQRAELLQQHGADHVIVLQTTRDLLQLTAAEFFNEVLCRRFDARTIVEGDNFGFGKNREGDIGVLKELAAKSGRTVVVVAPQDTMGKRVSSSRVRGELVSGDVHSAAEMLGRPYRLEGVVVHGEHRGASLGFPTANLEQIATLIPAQGVYAGRVEWEQTTYAVALNIGPNPTFGEDRQKIEVHVIDFDGNLYGRRLGVDMIQRLRDTRAFASRDDLVDQLGRDVLEAKRLAEN